MSCDTLASPAADDAIMTAARAGATDAGRVATFLEQPAAAATPPPAQALLRRRLLSGPGSLPGCTRAPTCATTATPAAAVDAAVAGGPVADAARCQLQTATPSLRPPVSIPASPSPFPTDTAAVFMLDTAAAATVTSGAAAVVASSGRAGRDRPCLSQRLAIWPVSSSILEVCERCCSSFPSLVPVLGELPVKICPSIHKHIQMCFRFT